MTSCIKEGDNLNKKLEYGSLDSNLVYDEFSEKVRSTLPEDRKNWQTNPVEMQIIRLIIKQYNIKNIVEIGTLGGYSAISMASVLKDIDRKGRVYTFEEDQSISNLANKNVKKFELNDYISIFTGDVMNNLNINCDDMYDMIYIDGDRNHYLDYLDWAEYHIKKGGIIVASISLRDKDSIEKATMDPNIKWDDSWVVIRKFLDRIHNDDRYESTLFPTRAGMSIAVKLF